MSEPYTDEQLADIRDAHNVLGKYDETVMRLVATIEQRNTAADRLEQLEADSALDREMRDQAIADGIHEANRADAAVAEVKRLRAIVTDLAEYDDRWNDTEAGCISFRASVQGLLRRAREATTGQEPR